ncbi:timeless protein, partial [Oesophagostomum dentatum]
TIRDLIRFLRNDSNTLLARKICGERNIIENDLIPIIKSDNLKDKMFDIALRLLANLTQPAIVSLQGKQPEDREEWQTFWTLEENLRRAKVAFADAKFFSVLKQKLVKYFNETEWEDRFEEDRLVMERIIVLLRYIFSISPTDRDGKRTTTESSSHDRLISAFLESGIDEVLIYIASQSKERDFHLSILVIFALIVKEHSPEDIVTAGRDRTAAEKEKAEEELRQAVEIEQARLEAQRRKVLASRHSRFSGSYVVKGLSAVNKEKDLVVVKPIKDVNEFKFLDERKAKRRVAKNRR